MKENSRRSYFKMTIAVLLCMLLVIPLVACKTETEEVLPSSETSASTKETSEKTEATEEPMTLDKITFVARSGVHPEDWENSELYQLIAERFGLDIDLQVIDNSAYAEKFQVMFSTNNLPDLCNLHGVSVSDINEAGEQGVFLNYFDYMEYMPNLSEILTENSTVIPFIMSGSGNLYFGPTYYGLGESLGGTMFAARKDMLDAAGFDYTNLNDIDDVYAMLEALKAQDPDKYVFSSQYKLGNLFNFGETLGVGQDPGTWHSNEKEWVATYKEEGFKDFLKFWSNAYNDGILHPDFMTMERTDYWQKIYSGELSAFYDAGTGMDDAIKNTNIEDMEYTHVILPEYNGERYGLASIPGLGSSMGKLINANTAVPEKLVKFIDWLYTSEGWGRVWLGEEGVDYVVMQEEPFEWINLDETYKDTLPAEYADKLLSPDESAARKSTLPYQVYGFYARNYLSGNLQKMNYYTVETLYQAAYPEYSSAGLFGPANPSIVLTDELDEFNNLKTTIKDYADEIIAQMITGQLDIDGYWDTFMNAIEGYGYDRLMELYKTSADNFYAVEPNFP